MTTTTTLLLRNLTTGYHTRHGLKAVSSDINASLSSGELTCLLGPNGAGKSTLLRTLAGFNSPLEGEILLMGQPLKSYSSARLSRLVSVVLTERLMVSEMTVEELVGMGRAPYTGFWGRLSGTDRRVVAESLKAVGVEHMASRAIQTLSDGERQKVMIAKALAQETPVILLDEPTAFLDYPSKVETMHLLHTLAHNQNKTIFLSTHDLELALRTADNVWLIDRTLGITEGTPEDLALRGCLGKYFERPGITFDVDEGVFEIAMEPNGHTVQLRGSGPLLHITKRALRRAGYTPAATGPVVEVAEDSLSLNDKKFDTIAGLLSGLTSLHGD
ncbi:MAG: ABC transporter ATP-binding protein [Muribaculaceae bacterium]|nr:ABC transporter ATP-binding protein [Muribaculaceae bacterium]